MKRYASNVHYFLVYKLYLNIAKRKKVTWAGKERLLKQGWPGKTSWKR